MNELLAGLNDKQKEAVLTLRTAPYLAGAGSEKPVFSPSNCIFN